MNVAEYGNNRIQQLTTGEQFLQTFGQYGSGQGQFSAPISVIVDHRDRVIIANHCNHRVMMLNQKGQWLNTINGNVSGAQGFQYPYGLALDHQVKGTSMLQPGVLTQSKSSHQREPLSDHMEM